VTEKPLRIAVVGSGVAGISAAWLLAKRHEVTLFEKADRIGGHTNTVLIDDGPDAGTAIDTGFIVCNDKTYPNFHKFLDDLKVPWRWADMSFGYWDMATNLQYAGTNMDGLFAQRSNLLNPAFLKMLLEIRRFCRIAVEDRQSGYLDMLTLGEYLRRRRFKRYFVDHYIVPMGAAIWSTAAPRMLQFPARTFVDFFRNHGLLSIKDRPRWQTVVGGSHSYLKAFRARFKGRIETAAWIDSIHREPGSVTIRLRDGEVHAFDRVVIAVHADQVLPLLADPTAEEKAIFGVWKYEPNRVTLHWDKRVLPPNRRAWASWNYVREPKTGGERRQALSMTYHMNRLQGLQTTRQYCVTLNREQPIPPRFILQEIDYTHPLYTNQSIATQEQLPTLSGKNDTFYCGSYHGYGFHEDAVKSAVAVAEKFGIHFGR
jgi:predicted NAD/FAD-binding protein